MTSEVKQLKARITLPNGRYVWGSISRVSERLDVARTTVCKWLAGEWQPGEVSLAGIRALLADKKAVLRYQKSPGRPRVNGSN